MFKRPNPGDDFRPLFTSARFWQVLVDVANRYVRDGFSSATAESRDTVVTLTNATGDRQPGELVQVSTLTEPTANIIDAYYESPHLTTESVTWHTAIDKVTPVPFAVADGELFEKPTQFSRVKLKSGTSGPYLMIDPDTPTQMIAGTSGIYKTIGIDATNNIAVADLTQSQLFFHYELLQDPQGPSTTRARLRFTDDTELSSTAEINLSDPLGMLSGSSAASGYVGMCQLVGNTFEDRGGPCP